MRFASILALLLVGVVACDACSKPAADPHGADDYARASARGVVETLETVWMTTAKMCIAVAASQDSQSVADDCKRYLQPAREAIVAAGDAVDTWDAASQANFPCLIVSAVDGINQGLGIATQAGLEPPQVIKDGQVLAGLFVPHCTKDGGANSLGDQ